MQATPAERTVYAAALVGIVLMVLFPPWIPYTVLDPGLPPLPEGYEYVPTTLSHRIAPIWDHPGMYKVGLEAKVDTSLLALELLALLAAAVFTSLLFRTRAQKERRIPPFSRDHLRRLISVVASLAAAGLCLAGGAWAFGPAIAGYLTIALQRGALALLGAALVFLAGRALHMSLGVDRA